jgi:hypothetical protein
VKSAFGNERVVFVVFDEEDEGPMRHASCGKGNVSHIRAWASSILWKHVSTQESVVYGTSRISTVVVR